MNTCHHDSDSERQDGHRHPQVGCCGDTDTHDLGKQVKHRDNSQLATYHRQELFTSSVNVQQSEAVVFQASIVG